MACFDGNDGQYAQLDVFRVISLLTDSSVILPGTEIGVVSMGDSVHSE